MVELTNLEGLLIFVAIDSIELVEEELDCTLICTKSGNYVYVLEEPSEVIFEINRIKEEQIMFQMGMH